MASATISGRPTVIALDGESGLVLEGRFAPGADSALGGAVIAPPHPLYGGSMDSPVVGEVAQACHANGLASLCFNWRGIGASAGEANGDPEAARRDYSAALGYMSDSVSGPVVVCGYSFGAAAAVLGSRGAERAARMLLVAPPGALLDRDALLRFSGDVLLVVGERDTWAPPTESRALVEGVSNVELLVLPGADHFFMAALRELGQAVTRWLGKGRR